jgi:hypothetical protein
MMTYQHYRWREYLNAAGANPFDIQIDGDACQNAAMAARSWRPL